VAFWLFGRPALSFPVMQPNVVITELALAFAHALVAGDFQAAHRMLTPELAEESSTDELRDEYESMVSYWIGPPDTVKVGQVLEASVTDGVPDGLGWVCVDIDRLNGPGGCDLEGVTVFIKAGANGPVISRLVWGRP
jgi:hypothetical protein